jgi:hypothetical protein
MFTKIRNHYREPGNSFGMDMALGLMALGAVLQVVALVLKWVV